MQMAQTGGAEDADHPNPSGGGQGPDRCNQDLAGVRRSIPPARLTCQQPIQWVQDQGEAQFPLRDPGSTALLSAEEIQGGGNLGGDLVALVSPQRNGGRGARGGSGVRHTYDCGW